MSATLPSEEEMEDLYEAARIRHENHLKFPTRPPTLLDEQINYLPLSRQERVKTDLKRLYEKYGNESDVKEEPVEKCVPVAFISGPLDISQEEFLAQYKLFIDKAISLDHKFVIGNARGTDTFAREYLDSVGLGSKTTIYPYYYPNQNIKNITYGQCNVMNLTYKNITERDDVCTRLSTYDIVFIRSDTEVRRSVGETKFDPNRITGTKANVLRRIEMMSFLPQ